MQVGNVAHPLPDQIRAKTLCEGHHKACGVAAQALQPKQRTGNEPADGELQRQLLTAGEPLVSLVHDLDVVIGKADGGANAKVDRGPRPRPGGSTGPTTSAWGPRWRCR